MSPTPFAGDAPGRPPRWIKPALLAIAVVALMAAIRILPVQVWLASTFEWIQTLGVLGLVVLGAVYVAACILFLPGFILTLGAGFLASALWTDRPLLALAAGTATVSIASVTGATAAFLLGRTFARDWITQKVNARPRFKALDQAIGENGLKMVFLVRLSPIFPFNLLNFALGLTQVRLRDYVLASWIGMLPGTIMYVYFGSLAQNVAAVLAGKVEGGAGQKAILVIGLLATIILVAYVTRVAKRALRAVVTE